MNVLAAVLVVVLLLVILHLIGYNLSGISERGYRFLQWLESLLTVVIIAPQWFHHK